MLGRSVLSSSHAVPIAVREAARVLRASLGAAKILRRADAEIAAKFHAVRGLRGAAEIANRVDEALTEARLAVEPPGALERAGVVPESDLFPASRARAPTPRKR